MCLGEGYCTLSLCKAYFVHTVCVGRVPLGIHFCRSAADRVTHDSGGQVGLALHDQTTFDRVIITKSPPVYCGVVYTYVYVGPYLISPWVVSLMCAHTMRQIYVHVLYYSGIAICTYCITVESLYLHTVLQWNHYIYILYYSGITICTYCTTVESLYVHTVL